MREGCKAPKEFLMLYLNEPCPICGNKFVFLEVIEGGNKFVFLEVIEGGKK